MLLASRVHPHHDFSSIMRGFRDWCRLWRQSWKWNEKGHRYTCAGAIHGFVHQGKMNASPLSQLVETYRKSFREAEPFPPLRAYIALVFTDAPPLNVHVVLGDPDLLGEVALFDLSEACRGRRFGVTINRTDSVVFREFEVFLATIYGITHDSLEHCYCLDQASGVH